MKFLGLIVALLMLAGCNGSEPDGGPGKEGNEMDAASMKRQVDDAVLALGPSLADALQAEIRAAGAHFIACPMSSDEFHYAANIGLVGPANEKAGDLIAGVVRKAGFEDVTVTPPTEGDTGSVIAHKGKVALDTLLSASGTPATVHNVHVSIDCVEFDDEGQQFAEDDPGTQYPELQ